MVNDREVDIGMQIDKRRMKEKKRWMNFGEEEGRKWYPINRMDWNMVTRNIQRELLSDMPKCVWGVLFCMVSFHSHPPSCNPL